MATETEGVSDENQKREFNERANESKSTPYSKGSTEKSIKLLGLIARMLSTIKQIAIDINTGFESKGSVGVIQISSVKYGMDLFKSEVSNTQNLVHTVIHDYKNSEPLGILDINNRMPEIYSRLLFLHNLGYALKNDIDPNLIDTVENAFSALSKMNLKILREALFSNLDDLIELGEMLNVKDQAILKKNELFKQIVDNSQKINAAFALSSGGIIVLGVIALVMFVWLRNSSLGHAYEEETVKNKALDSINNIYKRQIDSHEKIPKPKVDTAKRVVSDLINTILKFNETAQKHLNTYKRTMTNNGTHNCIEYDSSKRYLDSAEDQLSIANLSIQNVYTKINFIDE